MLLPEQLRQRGLRVGIVGSQLHQLLRISDCQRQVAFVAQEGDQAHQHLTIRRSALMGLLQNRDCLVRLAGGIQRHRVNVAVPHI